MLGIPVDRTHQTQPIAAIQPLADGNPLNPAREALGLPFYSDEDHVAEFTRAELTAIHAAAGWEVVEAAAFVTAGFHRLGLSHAVGNGASCRVAVKAGFVAEGVRRSAWLQADGRHDAHVHARLRSDPAGGRPPR